MNRIQNIPVLVFSLFAGLVAAPARAQPRWDDIQVKGVNIHTAQGNEIDAIGQMHLNWVRIDVNWQDIQPTQFTWDWSSTDGSINAARARGLNVYANITATPSWACRQGQAWNDGSCVPANVGMWTSFMTAVVQRYITKINAYGIWNEPNLPKFWQGSPDDWATILFLPAAQVIRGVAPWATIAAADLSTSPSVPTSGFYRAMEQYGLSQYIDVLSIHAYEESGHSGPNGILFAGLNQVEVIDNFNCYWDWDEYDCPPNPLTAKPIWITEFGFATGGDSGFGDDVLRVFSLFGPGLGSEQTSRIHGLFNFQLMDSSSSELQGLLRADGSWKPGAYKLQSHLNPWGTSFFTVIPCRLIDTRQDSGVPGSWGPPSLQGHSSTAPYDTDRFFSGVGAGHCQVPAYAKALSAVVTVLNYVSPGQVTVHPDAGSRPNALTATYAMGDGIANVGTVIPLSAKGGFRVFSSQNADLIVDVNGYFTDWPAGR